MKTFPPILIRTAGLCLLALAQPARSAEGDEPPAFPLGGTWRWTFTMPNGTTVRPKLKLAMADGQITGTTSFRPGSEAPITNAVISGDELRFQVIRQRQGQDVVTTYRGKWSETAIKGSIESDWAGEKQTFAWDAQRAHLGVEGVWRWTNSFFTGFGGGRGFGSRGGEGGPDGSTNVTARSDGSTNAAVRPGGTADRGPGRGSGGRGFGGPRVFETRVELEQDGEKVTGKTISRFGRPVEISNGVFTNGVLYFEIERDFVGIKSVTKHLGRQNGDTIIGTLETEIEGEDRTIDWEARRVD
jgi:hypothetical protein